MKFYTVSITRNLLIIEKKKNRRVLEIFYVLIQTLLLSIALGYTIYFSFPPSKRSYLFLLTTIVVISILLMVFFKESLKERAVTLLLDGNDLVFNGTNIGRVDSIDSLVIEEYISAEAITGVRTIKLKTDQGTISILSGVNEVDYKEMISTLKTFLTIPDSKLLEKIC